MGRSPERELMSDTPILNLAPGLDLPLQSVTETFGIVGVRGSGKTATAGVITEEMVMAGAHVVVVDPTGAWWGLRSNAEGDGPGLPVYVLGGDHGDLPLSPTSGELIAGLVVQRRWSVVLDLSRMDDDDQVRFLADFCGRLYLDNREPLHLVCDEAQILAPQTPERGPHQVRLRKAMGHLVQRGRIRGIGCTLITQRPALVSKNVWTQVETLLCLRMTGSQDVEAIDAWIRANASVEQRQEMLASLSGLETGEAWLWSPGLLQRFERVRIRRRRTFDSSRTPRVGETIRQPEQLAAVDLASLRAEISATIAAAAADDPAALRAEIERLKAQLCERPAPEPIVERVEVPVVPPALMEALGWVRSAQRRLDTVTSELGLPVGPPGREATVAPESDGADGNPQSAFLLRHQVRAGDTQRDTVEPLAPNPRPPAAPASTVQLKAGERRTLEALAKLHPIRITRAQLGTLANLTPSGGTWNGYWTNLTRAQLVEEIRGSGLVGITPQGFAALGKRPPAAVNTRAERLDLFRRVLPNGPRRLFAALEAAPGPLTANGLAQRVGLTAGAGTFNGYLSTLKRNGLVEEVRGGYRLHSRLFGDGK